MTDLQLIVLRKEIDALRAELAETARRYQWLIDNIDPSHVGLNHPIDYFSVGDPFYTRQLTEQIDAAIAKEKDNEQ